MRGFRLLTMAVVFAASGPAAAAGDPGQGRAAAERWCGSCHTVGQTARGADTAPSFASIARIRSDEFLRGFLTRPHPPMPPIDISRQDIDDLVAYIASQRGQ